MFRLIFVLFALLIPAVLFFAQANAQYQIPSDDPILTYKVKYNEEFLGKRETPRPWYEAVKQGIETGQINNRFVRDKICKTLQTAWEGESGEFAEILEGYKVFQARASKHASLVGGILHRNPIVNRGRIVYMFREVKNSSDFNENAFVKNVEQIKSGFKEKRKDQVKTHFEKTGLGFSGWVKTYGNYETSIEETENGRVFVAKYDVSKEGFINFPSKEELQTPPEYLYEDHQIILSNWYNQSKNNIKRLANFKKMTVAEYLNHKLNLKLELIDAKPVAFFSLVYAVPYKNSDTSRTNHMLIHYTSHFDHVGNGEIKIGKQQTSVSCEIVKNDLPNLGRIEPAKPFFDMYSLSERRSCKPYLDWYNCYIMNHIKPECQTISKKQPEFCEEK